MRASSPKRLPRDGNLNLPETATTSTGPKLLLLSTLNHREDQLRGLASAGWSLGFHVVAIVVLSQVKYRSAPPRPPEQFLVKHVTPLYMPPELTQKAPNKTPLKKELTLESIAAKPILKSPTPAPAAKQATAAKQIPLPPVQAQQPAPKPLIVEAPKLDVAPPSPQAPQIANTQTLPPPPGNAPPKIAFEDVAPKTAPTGGRVAGGIAMPSSSVQEAMRALTHNGGAGASSLGDTVTDDGIGAGLNLPPSAGRPQSSIQLKSDAQGADFRPYMIQVLAAIRRNWLAVYPEAAKTGMRGQVILQFRIDQKGQVVKVVFNGQSSSRPLNEAAVAAISASTPMPPFPAAFKGDSVVLQMTFLYNMPR
jgi:TonB family protein